MFCPKCGGSNPDNGKFCRSCGTGLGNITDALNTSQPISSPAAADGQESTIEGAITRIFTGIAFLIVAIILGVTGAAGGKSWWFWMLIPAFGSMGTGIAQYMQIRKREAARSLSNGVSPNSIDTASINSLPAQRVDLMGIESRYKTGDLVPPSVVENTTRHLEIDSEGQTMTLPKN